MDKTENKAKLEVRIENLRRSNKTLLSRAILLIAFSIVALTFCYIHRAETIKRNDLTNSQVTIDQYKPSVVYDITPKEVWLIFEQNLFETNLSHVFDSLPEERYGDAYHAILDSLYTNPMINDKKIQTALQLLGAVHMPDSEMPDSGRIKIYHLTLDSLISDFKPRESEDLKIPINQSTISAFKLADSDTLLKSNFEGDTMLLTESILNSTSRRLDQKINEIANQENSPKGIEVFGLEINGYIWGAFASIIYTVIFLNFSRLLQYRDKLWKKLKKLGVKPIDIGSEFFEVYTPYKEFKKTRLPSRESIIFTLFLALSFTTVFILEVQPRGNHLPNSDYTFSWINLICSIIIAFEILKIALRQNLLGINFAIKEILGKKYLDKNRKVSFRDFGFIYFMATVLMFISVASIWINFFSRQTMEPDDNKLINVVFFTLSLLLSLPILPIGLYLQKRYNNALFRALAFSGCITYIFWALFFFTMYFPWQLHSNLLVSWGIIAWIVIGASFILHLLHNWNKKTWKPSR